ncbi:MAG: large conductance mechanosensitive channel protein MscL, partial [Anaerolineae bacterium]|nr:large conductance mechanosensitive channel protein MscL [Anaerolineae bacterium]
MLKEFRDFINKGNVLDLAVAVILGGAFGAIVTSFVNDIIMPLVGIILGGVNFAGLTIDVGSAKVGYGNFIQAIILFLIIAWVMFMVVKAANATKKPAAPAPPPGPNQRRETVDGNPRRAQESLEPTYGC